MRTTNLLFSAVQFIFVVVLFLLSGLFLGAEHTPQFRYALAHVLIDNTGDLAFIGYGILGFTLLLLWGFFTMNRGSYYQIEMQKIHAQVEPEVIRRYVHSYWKEIFPEQMTQPDVIVHRKRTIEIFAEMPEMQTEDLQVLLPKIEEELGLLLAHTFGYHRSFLLTISSS